MKFQLLVGMLAALLACAENCMSAQTATQATAPLGAAGAQEEIEWTWEVRPAHADAKLPNVLLVGDSITRNYFPVVQKQLAAAANVYLFATSACAGDPRLPDQLKEFARMERVSFKVVHFNNGMHGWTYNEAEYAAGLKDAFTAIQSIAPEAAVIWASTTPVRGETQPGPTNARVMARNAVALSLIKKAALSVDDQHELMEQHPDLYEDNVHFNALGAGLEGNQATGLIRKALSE
jgi:hypothetical protein